MILVKMRIKLLMKTSLKKQFELLRNIEPDKEWKIREREILFTQIRGQVADQYSTAEMAIKRVAFSWEILRTFSPSFIFRPVGAVMLALGFIGIGSVASVSASRSLPGDTFYPVKLMTEQAQLAFSSSKENRAHLEIEFAGRRLEELQQITTKGNTANVVKTVERAKTSLANAEKTLTSFGEEKGTGAVEAAKNIEGKTAQYGESLSKTIESLPANIQEEVAPTVSDTLKQIGTTSNVALSTLVISGEKGVSTLLANRIFQMRTKLGELRGTVESRDDQEANTIKESFNEIDELLLEAEGVLKTEDNGKALEMLSKAGDLLIAVQKEVAALPPLIEEETATEVLNQNNK